MPNILVRDLGDETIKHIKERARRNGRSMQSEIKSIIENAARSESRDTLCQAPEMDRGCLIFRVQSPY